MVELLSTFSEHGLFEGKVEVDPSIIELLQQIAAQPDSGVQPSSSARPESSSVQVVFDVHVGSSRYILTRAYPQAAISLSPREKEIARLIAKGLPNKVISDILDISPWTVATHLRRVFAKLGVSSRAEMVALVIQAGMLE